jgi:hypothetical protein
MGRDKAGLPILLLSLSWRPSRVPMGAETGHAENALTLMVCATLRLIVKRCRDIWLLTIVARTETVWWYHRLRSAVSHTIY